MASPGGPRTKNACVLAKIWKRKRSEGAADIFLKMLRSLELFMGCCVMLFGLTYPARLIGPDPALTIFGA
jgi:hypothetical protein